MSKNVFFVSIMLVYSMGCATSNEPAPPAPDATIVPASAQSARAVPGLVAWQIHPTSDGVEVTGVDSQGRTLSRSTMHSTTLDNTGTRLVEIVGESSTLRLTARGDQILGREMVGQPSPATSHLVSDLQASDAVQPYGCGWSVIKAALECTAATMEGGLNPLADGLCVIALAEYVDECL